MKQNKFRAVAKNWQLYVLAAPALIVLLLFCYLPMGGLVIAFKDYLPGQGLFGGKWAQPLFKHFKAFAGYPFFKDIVINTLRISLIGFLNFPLPILFALLLNEIRSKKAKSFFQILSYAPYFVSVVVVVGLCRLFLEANMDRTGGINKALVGLGILKEPKKFMESSAWFPWIYNISGLWQGLGWWSITYVAALVSIDPTLYEAAKIDGAGRMRCIRHINLPALVPIMSITLIMTMGGILSVGFEKVLLMQNQLNFDTSNIISTYVYDKTIGAVYKQYSYGTAIGLFNSVISFILVVIANVISKRIGGESFI